MLPIYTRGTAVLAGLAFLCASITIAHAQEPPEFVNWETPHVNPIDMTPDGSRLLVVNTADDRLEVFRITRDGLRHDGHLASVPVGLDPVSVRARSDGEAWVANQVSDSVSIVDLETMNVVRTLSVGDEPSDIVFAGSPERAFVSLALPGEVKVYDPNDLDAPPGTIEIQGHRPRALATDGTTVYAAIFEAGNLTTIIGEDTVASDVNPYPGNPNPPPNDGDAFNPPIAAGLPQPPHTSLILKRHPDGTWRDDNDADWSEAVTWDLHGHDVAVIDAGSLDVSYVTGLLTLNMHLTVSPSGDVTVVGSDALNEIRFEPNIRGTFIRVNAGTFPAGGGEASITDLNPHLGYETDWIPAEQRERTISDPRGVAFEADGDRAFITGMGTNNLIEVDRNMNRLGRVEVGEGPTGVIVDDRHHRVYVLNKFEGTVSVLTTQPSLHEIQRIAFFDPTPPEIIAGRPHLYDAHHSSGLGLTSCASCHVDGRLDQIAWDLGNPQGEMKVFNQRCNTAFGIGFLEGLCEDWHPMKGPMTTQTLVGIIGTEPFHWRGDREDLAAFNQSFPGLLGRGSELTEVEMQEFTDFVATLRFPPNPHRNIDNSLPTDLDGGNAAQGEQLFENESLDGGVITCAACHAQPTGTTGELTSANLLQEAQSMKVPQLRNMHEKGGFFMDSQENDRGFGLIHDGSVDTMFNFLHFPAFTFESDQQRRDVAAFMMSFSTDTHAGVGVQTTVDSPNPPMEQLQLLQLMLSMADAQEVGVVVRGIFEGERRGFAYVGGGVFQSDRAEETYTGPELLAGAGPGSELTATIVPYGSEIRIGIDRDSNGYFDGDELDAGADPTDPASTPQDPCPNLVGDLNNDCLVNIADLLIMLSQWGPCTGETCPADLNDDGVVDAQDLRILLESRRNGDALAERRRRSQAGPRSTGNDTPPPPGRRGGH